jgi:hypothetical protein
MDDMIDTAPGAKTNLLDYPLILIDLSVIPKEKFTGHPALQALLETLQRASEGKLVKEFDRITDCFTTIKDDPRAGDWLHSLVRYAVSVSEIGSGFISKVFSKVFNEREAHEMAMTTAQKWLQEGEARGEARGVTKGKAEMVLSALRTRFGKIPKWIEKGVLGMSDPIALESLLAQAIQSDTLDEFSEVLR